MTFAQQATAVDVNMLQQAVGDRNWPIAAVCVILLAVRAAKLPIFGSFWDRVPKHVRPLIPVGLGIVSGVGEALLAHRPWAPALFYGVLSGLIAIGTDQAITKPLKKSTSTLPIEKYQTSPLIEQASNAPDTPGAVDNSKAAPEESSST